MEHTPDPGRMLAINSEHRLRSENLAFDIDVWYPRMQLQTPRTVFLPLSRPEATAIVHFQATRYLSRAALVDDDFEVLGRLEQRIDACVRSEFGVNGAMLRLCGRSPKDGQALHAQDVWQRYQNELRGLLDAGAEDSANTKLRAISRTPYLRVTSGEEAICLLLSSERVFADCRDWLEYGEPEQIALRAWVPNMQLEYEVRVFVCNNRVTAMTQYDHYAVYPDLLRMRARVEERVLAAWARAHAAVAEASYVIDFAYLPDVDEAIVIELSPFLPCTGTALFSWATDAHILRDGPYEFRVNTVPRSNMDDVIEINWAHRWLHPPPPYRDVLRELARPAARSGAWLVPTAACMAGITLAGTSASLAVLQTPLLPLLAALPALVGSVYMRPSAPRTLLFVYGTLKAGFQWHQKFLFTAWAEGPGTTAEAHPLVVGASGVPYMLARGCRPDGLRVRGEVYAVDAPTLLGLDQYEGVGKGYYARQAIEVVLASGISIMAQVYCMTKPPPALLAAPVVDEYPLAYHRAHYNAIQHIRAKQERYLGTAGSAEQT